MVEVLVTVRAGVWAVSTVASDGVEVTVEVSGGVPLAVAESLTEPLSRSAWVRV